MPRRTDRTTRWLRGLAALLVLPLLGLAAVAAAQTAAPRPPAIYYAHTDHLGTPHALTDETGAVVWQAEYTPFGTATVSSDEVVLNLRFPGQYFDQETGLHYNYFRTYDPSTGRYLESDPIGVLRGYGDPQLQVAIQAGVLEETGFAGEELNHLYGYVGQNPLVWIDPFGLASKGNGGDGSASGKNTANPYKHCREVPGKPIKYNVEENVMESGLSFLNRQIGPEMPAGLIIAILCLVVIRARGIRLGSLYLGWVMFCSIYALLVRRVAD